MKKYILPGFVITALSPVSVLSTFAQTITDIKFHPLDGVGIAGLTDKATAGNLPSLLNAGYQLLIGIASVLAVVMIFYAGFRYATTVSPGAKNRR